MEVELKVQVADPLHIQIERQLEQAIRSGQLAPGQRLPATTELVKKWGVNYAAIQRAMDRLSAAGLVERKPGRGTFVQSVTDKAVVGILVGPDLLEESAHFFRGMVKAIQHEIGVHGWRDLVYDRLTYSDPKSLTDTEKRLLEDVHNHRFKGLVLVGFGNSCLRKELLQLDLPKSVYSASNETTVDGDSYEFAYLATSHLAQRGRKQIAYFRTFTGSAPPLTRDIEGFRQAMVVHGLKMTPRSIYQIRITPPGIPFPRRYGHDRMMEWAQQWQHTGLRPDGLIVSDDMVAEGVTLALNELRIPVPEQLELVTMANEEVEYSFAVPTARYEYSLREIAHSMISVLWKRMTGEPLPPLPVRIKGRLIPAT